MNIAIRGLFLAILCTGCQAMIAKTVNVTNGTDEPIRVDWTHFVASGLKRPLIVEDFILASGQQKQFEVKPYSYNSDLYFPDEDYSKAGYALSRADENKLKDAGLFVNMFIVSSEDGKTKKAFFLLRKESGAGSYIKDLPEKGLSDPSTGFFVRIQEDGKYVLEIVTPEGSKNYKAVSGVG